MTIYTGSGDRGKTGLFSGERISKADTRIQACGAVDELNSWLGALIAEITGTQTDLIAALHKIQADLFLIGAWISTTKDSPASLQLRPFDTQSVDALEKGIDEMEAILPGLNRFILPGGHRSSAWAHIARSVCRRCESYVVQIQELEESAEMPDGHAHILKYLNRLSDYLFTAARFCNHLHDQKDTEWQG